MNPNNLHYIIFQSSHAWIRDEKDGTATVGITDHAQDALGDLVFVELPQVGKQISKENQIGVIESVKAASDLYSPLTGEIVAANAVLEDSPETVNDDPYDNGWIYKIKMQDPTEINQLLSADDYQKLLEET